MLARISNFLLVAMIAGIAVPTRVGAEEGEIQLGRQLIVRMGCAGCHRIADPALDGLGKSGPDLRRIAAKTSPGWALEWVMAPRELRPTTWMPHFFEEGDRAEARAIVAYLWDRSLRPDYPAPPDGDLERGGELFESVGCTGCHIRRAGAGRGDFRELHRLQGSNLIHLGSKVDASWLFAWLENPRRYAPETTMPDLRLSRQEAADLTSFLMASRAPERESFESLVAEDVDVEAGREAITLYGCYGCHRIPGFEDAGDHASQWASAEGFSGHGLAGLPDFALSDREAEAIRSAVGGSHADAEALLAGRQLITRYNCRGCHLIEGRGYAISATVEDPGMLPPNLNGEGSRVQSAWLVAYLDDPARARLRPWLHARMPTFGFSEPQTHALVSYFGALEEEQLAEEPATPLAARDLALGRETFDLMPCGRCHPTSPEAAGAAGVDAASLAPSLAVSSRRLRYEWIEAWLRDPQSWLPGTKMPTFFMRSRSGTLRSPFVGIVDAPFFAEPKARLLEHVDSEEELGALMEDADAVIAAMRDYVWSLGERAEE